MMVQSTNKDATAFQEITLARGDTETAFLLKLDYKTLFSLNADPITELDKDMNLYFAYLRRGAMSHDGTDAEGNLVAAHRSYKTTPGNKWLCSIGHYKDGKPYNPSIDEPAEQSFDINGVITRARRIDEDLCFQPLSPTEIKLLNMKKGLIPLEIPVHFKPTTFTPV